MSEPPNCLSGSNVPPAVLAPKRVSTSALPPPTAGIGVAAGTRRLVEDRPEPGLGRLLLLEVLLPGGEPVLIGLRQAREWVSGLRLHRGSQLVLRGGDVRVGLGFCRKRADATGPAAGAGQQQHEPDRLRCVHDVHGAPVRSRTIRLSRPCEPRGCAHSRHGVGDRSARRARAGAPLRDRDPQRSHARRTITTAPERMRAPHLAPVACAAKFRARHSFDSVRRGEDTTPGPHETASSPHGHWDGVAIFADLDSPREEPTSAAPGRRAEIGPATSSSYCAFTSWKNTSCCVWVWPESGSSGLTGSVTVFRASPQSA